MKQDMRRLIILLAVFLGCSFKLQSQDTYLSPELVTGHRSLAYQHFLNHAFNQKIRFNNLILYDTEYNDNANNIYFMRNSLGYSLNPNLSVNAALGIKNPGSFATIFAQYQYKNPMIMLLYSAGVTYQRGFSLEQSLIFECIAPIKNEVKAYFRLQALGDLTSEAYPRGFQYLRLGIRTYPFTYGLAANLDQFDDANFNLKNVGIFFRYN
jgi:hypothetical protein